MNRRNFLGAAAVSGVAGAAPSAASKGAIFELIRIQLRNGPQNQKQRTQDFLKNAVLPATQRAGIGPVAFFASGTIAQETPFLLAVLSYPSLAAMEIMDQKLEDDGAYQKAYDEFYSSAELNYERIEISLLRGFDSFPYMVPPPVDAKRPPRLFELRTYESNNSKTLARKIKMFGDGEIAIFKHCGLLPVFFGQTIVGRNMPNLTYMLAYDDWASREKVWKTFLADPEWQKLRSQPGFSDMEVVSNITNSLLAPLPFSPVR
jgi:hypothetical protein